MNTKEERNSSALSNSVKLPIQPALGSLIKISETNNSSLELITMTNQSAEMNGAKAQNSAKSLEIINENMPQKEFGTSNTIKPLKNSESDEIQNKSAVINGENKLNVFNGLVELPVIKNLIEQNESIAPNMTNHKSSTETKMLEIQSKSAASLSNAEIGNVNISKHTSVKNNSVTVEGKHNITTTLHLKNSSLPLISYVSTVNNANHSIFRCSFKFEKATVFNNQRKPALIESPSKHAAGNNQNISIATNAQIKLVVMENLNKTAANNLNRFVEVKNQKKLPEINNQKSPEIKNYSEPAGTDSHNKSSSSNNQSKPIEPNHVPAVITNNSRSISTSSVVKSSIEHEIKPVVTESPVTSNNIEVMTNQTETDIENENAPETGNGEQVDDHENVAESGTEGKRNFFYVKLKV